jgi:hypothetical protein
MKARDSSKLRKNSANKSLPTYVRLIKKRNKNTYAIIDHPLCKWKSFRPDVLPPGKTWEEESLSMSLKAIKILNWKLDIQKDLILLQKKLKESIEYNKKIQDSLRNLSDLTTNAVQRLNGSWPA